VTIRVTYLASTLTIGMANEVSHLQCVFPPIAQCPVLIHLDLEVDRSYSFLLLSVQPTFMLWKFKVPCRCLMTRSASCSAASRKQQKAEVSNTADSSALWRLIIWVTCSRVTALVCTAQ
jgi:hypothetical protein